MYGMRLDQRGNIGEYAWNIKHQQYYQESIKYFDMFNNICKEETPMFWNELHRLYRESNIAVVGKGPISNWAACMYMFFFFLFSFVVICN
jgi:hypothetical protein